MFAEVGGTVEQGREARRRELVSICAQQARLQQRVTELVRAADDAGDWQAAGCSSSAQWLAQLSRSDHRIAARITDTSEALRSLPARRPLNEAAQESNLPSAGLRRPAGFEDPPEIGQLQLF